METGRLSPVVAGSAHSGGSPRIKLKHMKARDILFQSLTVISPLASEGKCFNFEALRDYLVSFYSDYNKVTYPTKDQQERKLPFLLDECFIALQLREGNLNDKKIFEARVAQGKANNESPSSPSSFRLSGLSSFEDIYRGEGRRRLDLGSMFQKRDFPSSAAAVTVVTATIRFCKRVLINGRAGIGKSTLLKYMAYLYSQAAGSASTAFVADYPWLKRFDIVLHLPLRCLNRYQLKEADDVNWQVARFIAEHLLLAEKDFPVQAIHQLLFEPAKAMIKGKPVSVCLLLDGLDEVRFYLGEGNHKQEKRQLLEHLLRLSFVRPHVYTVLTSRPMPLSLDNGLYSETDEECQIAEVMGFDNAAIEMYIAWYFRESPSVQNVNSNSSKHPSFSENGQKLEQLLAQQPVLLGAVHVPVVLSLVCELWQLMLDPEQNALLHQQNRHAISLTDIYQELTKKLCWWLTHKRAQGALSALGEIAEDSGESEDIIAISSEHRLLHFLGQLALNGSVSGEILLTPPLFNHALAQVKIEKNDYPLFLRALEESGFLCVSKERVTYSDKRLPTEVHFFHLSMQEFFAASAIKRAIITSLTAPNKTISYYDSHVKGKVQKEDLTEFIHRHKYLSSFEMIWPFVAGLLLPPLLDERDEQTRIAALKFFWKVLQDTPRDLGLYGDLSLWLRCLNEGVDEEIPDQQLMLESIKVVFKMVTETKPNEAGGNVADYALTLFRACPAISRYFLDSLIEESRLVTERGRGNFSFSFNVSLQILRIIEQLDVESDLIVEWICQGVFASTWWHDNRLLHQALSFLLKCNDTPSMQDKIKCALIQCLRIQETYRAQDDNREKTPTMLLTRLETVHYHRLFSLVERKINAIKERSPLGYADIQKSLLEGIARSIDRCLPDLIIPLLKVVAEHNFEGAKKKIIDILLKRLECTDLSNIVNYFNDLTKVNSEQETLLSVEKMLFIRLKQCNSYVIEHLNLLRVLLMLSSSDEQREILKPLIVNCFKAIQLKHTSNDYYSILEDFMQVVLEKNLLFLIHEFQSIIIKILPAVSNENMAKRLFLALSIISRDFSYLSLEEKQKVSDLLLMRLKTFAQNIGVFSEYIDRYVGFLMTLGIKPDDEIKKEIQLVLLEFIKDTSIHIDILFVRFAWACKVTQKEDVSSSKKIRAIFLDYVREGSPKNIGCYDARMKCMGELINKHDESILIETSVILNERIKTEGDYLNLHYLLSTLFFIKNYDQQEKVSIIWELAFRRFFKLVESFHGLFFLEYELFSALMRHCKLSSVMAYILSLPENLSDRSLQRYARWRLDKAVSTFWMTHERLYWISNNGLMSALFYPEFYSEYAQRSKSDMLMSFVEIMEKMRDLLPLIYQSEQGRAMWITDEAYDWLCRHYNNQFNFNIESAQKFIASYEAWRGINRTAIDIILEHVDDYPPSHHVTYYNLAYFYHIKRDFKNADNYFEEGIKASKKDNLCYIQISYVHSLCYRQDFSGALKLLDKFDFFSEEKKDKKILHACREESRCKDEIPRIKNSSPGIVFNRWEKDYFESGISQWMNDNPYRSQLKFDVVELAYYLRAVCYIFLNDADIGKINETISCLKDPTLIAIVNKLKTNYSQKKLGSNPAYSEIVTVVNNDNGSVKEHTVVPVLSFSKDKEVNDFLQSKIEEISNLLEETVKKYANYESSELKGKSANAFNSELHNIHCLFDKLNLQDGQWNRKNLSDRLQLRVREARQGYKAVGSSQPFLGKTIESELEQFTKNLFKDAQKMSSLNSNAIHKSNNDCKFM